LSVQTETNEMTGMTIGAAQRKAAKRLRIVLAGGSGHLGRILSRHFHSEGHRVAVLTRTPTAAPWRVVAWSGCSLDRWVRELDGADALINLCGRSVDCRYNAFNRREILESRVTSTRTLGEAIVGLATPPRLWMNASTATIYRHSLDRAMDEDNGEIGGYEMEAPPQWRFSSEVAMRWEDSFFQANTPGTRKVALRNAMVMSTGGGAFEMLLRLVRTGLGGAAGSGEQFMSWIHESDFARAVAHLMVRESPDEIVNIAAPCPLPNREFMAALRKAWGRSYGISAPTWMLEFGAVFLRTETELILKSRRVVPGRLLREGFQFAYPEWPVAARELVDRWRGTKLATRQRTGRGAGLRAAAGERQAGDDRVVSK
jgi:uncharacterized protein